MIRVLKVTDMTRNEVENLTPEKLAKAMAEGKIEEVNEDNLSTDNEKERTEEKSVSQILNLTPRAATETQKALGVIDPSNAELVRDIFRFKGVPTREELLEKSMYLKMIVSMAGVKKVMISGPGYFTPFLVGLFSKEGIDMMFPFYKENGEHRGFLTL